MTASPFADQQRSAISAGHLRGGLAYFVRVRRTDGTSVLMIQAAWCTEGYEKRFVEKLRSAIRQYRPVSL